ncbi:hypothetical protein BTJ66_11645 [Staphylococcus edaphicus]|uniref:Uncharacterized protein n=1 Tax=Staphylococcus edaphicus TaxID=1955013 RepID=A0A2C6VEQ4_9STAP|nr:hypothetical protein BTJ66_11645 [Staphylococcus edaphicus]
MFDKFFKKSLDASEPKNKHYIYSSNSKLTLDEAQQFWKKMAQKLVVGVMNSVDYTAERTFILISFNEKDPTIDIFFQMNGQLRMWNDLDNEAHKKVISDNIVAQAPNIVKQVNCIYSNVDMTRLAYAQIQYEFESKAWYLHDITEDSIESQLEKDPAFLKWFDDVSKSIDSLSLDGKHRITWGPFKPEY